jgi:LEA14-like dessication related protein
MSIGSSGRVVIEIEPEMKRALHLALRQNGSNMKEWFVQQAEAFLKEAERGSVAVESLPDTDRKGGR